MMTPMTVGDPSVIAIESAITQPYDDLGQRALGYFVIHVAGRRYGIRSPDATLLACSLDAVRRRLSRRGKHRVLFGSEPSATKIADAVRASMYDEKRQGECFFGLSSDEIRNALIAGEIVWAPDGDAAFDDGSHVLQFDLGDQVRLIAFKNAVSTEKLARTLVEAWVKLDEFYDVLDQWQSSFEAEWAAALMLATKH